VPISRHLLAAASILTGKRLMVWSKERRFRTARKFDSDCCGKRAADTNRIRNPLGLFRTGVVFAGNLQSLYLGLQRCPFDAKTASRSGRP